jgi:hypothetical protein
LCAFAITPVLFLFILGERTGSLLGFISLSLSDFYILIFSHPSFPDFHVRYSRTLLFCWERKVSACS